MSSIEKTEANTPRFRFGKNWLSFSKTVDPQIIETAIKSMKVVLDEEDLTGKTFLDIGSGSGLFSLAANRLGAIVRSFDYDSDSVNCTTQLRDSFGNRGISWEISQGSILDPQFLNALGTFEVVYCWGVLHHTGNLDLALENCAKLVDPGGKLVVSIYNDQGRDSIRWTRIKRLYSSSNHAIQVAILVPAFLRLWAPTLIYDALHGHILKTWRAYKNERGMSPMHDVVDWVGGYPFEVRTPEQIFQFFHVRGFQLVHLITRGSGRGCNEFTFVRK